MAHVSPKQMIGSDQEVSYDSNATSNKNTNSSIDALDIYSDSNVSHDIRSPKRPASLELRNIAFAQVSGSVMRSLISHESVSPWTLKTTESAEFDKLLGQLGNNGSTTVTPTSFLNPNNITEDQESFADKFTKRLDKLKEEREGWIPNLASECSKVDPVVVGDLSRYNDQSENNSHMPISPMHHIMYEGDETDKRIALAQSKRLKPLPALTSVAKTLHRNGTSCGLSISSNIAANSVQLYSSGDSPGVCSTHSGPILSNSSASSGSPPSGLIGQHSISGIPLHYITTNLLSSDTTISEVENNNILTVLSSAPNDSINTAIFVPAINATSSIFSSLSTNSVCGALSPIISTDVSSTNLHSNVPRVYGDVQLGCSMDTLPQLVHASLPFQNVRHFVSAASDGRILQQLNTSGMSPTSQQHLTVLPPSSALLASVAAASNNIGGLTTLGLGGLSNALNAAATVVGNSSIDANAEATLTQDECTLSDSERQQHSLIQQYQNQIILSDENGSAHLLVNTDGIPADQTQIGANRFGVINPQVLQPARPISLPPLNPRVMTVQHVADQQPCTFPNPSALDRHGLPGTPASLNSDIQQESTQVPVDPNRPRPQIVDSTKSSKSGSVCGRSLGGRRRGAATAAAAAELMRQTNGMKPLPPLHASCTSSPSAPSNLITGSSLLSACASLQPAQLQNTALPPPNVVLPCASSLPGSPLGPTCIKKSRSGVGEAGSSGRGKSAAVSPSTGGTKLSSHLFGSVTGGRKKSPVASQPCLMGTRVDTEVAICHDEISDPRGSEIDMLVIQRDSGGNHICGGDVDDLDGTSDVDDDNLSIPGFADMPSSPSKQKQWKLERKRARNRIAARRCRERKVSLIQSLEAKLADRDAEIRRLQAQLERYRMEGQHLMRSMEVLAATYPSLRDELPGLLRSIPEAVIVCTAAPNSLGALTVSDSMPPPAIPASPPHSPLPVSVVQITPSTVSSTRSGIDSNAIGALTSPSLSSIRFPVTTTLPPLSTAIGTEMHLSGLPTFTGSGQGITTYLKAE
ncbi:unnamed protein product [Protopolystoma xenopodis]|uniref:BZIP domain-containing protein n=1 Tax=Protopolystoma xenopodis TaxID=117903 RepID=A0A448XAR0_9PLAT|nr:unnamed protein product [Protopolystoma xenopodis]